MYDYNMLFVTKDGCMIFLFLKIVSPLIADPFPLTSENLSNDKGFGRSGNNEVHQKRCPSFGVADIRPVSNKELAEDIHNIRLL